MSRFEDDDAFSALTQRLDTESGDAWRVHEKALAMKKRGEDVVLLSIGDPDFRTPDPIVDNAVSHLRVGRTHYSPALGSSIYGARLPTTKPVRRRTAAAPTRSRSFRVSRPRSSRS